MSDAHEETTEQQNDEITQSDVVSTETWTDLSDETPTEKGEFEVMITETEVVEDNDPPETVVVAAGPLSTSWRVLTNDRPAVYITAAGIAVMGILEFPVLIGGLIAYEGLRRLVPRS